MALLSTGAPLQSNTVVQPPHTSDTERSLGSADRTNENRAHKLRQYIRNNLAAMFTTWDYHSSSVVENNSDFNQADQEEYRRYFSDYDAQDYELSSTSPSINAGTNIGLAGNPRISDDIVDTGAFEFQN